MNQQDALFSINIYQQ